MEQELLTRYLRNQVSPAERETVVAWLRAAPENEERVAGLASLMALVDADLAAIPSTPPPPAGHIMSLARSREVPRRGVRVPIGLAAAALLVIAAGFLAFRRRGPDPGFAAGEYLAGPTAAITVPLGDGSVVRLAPSSRLRAIGSGTERIVSLEGQAYFAVARLPGSPFEVRTRAGSVTVLGTRFDLRADADSLSLVVVEGAVALSVRGQRATVNAGEMSAVRAGRLEPPAPAGDLAGRLAWAGNFLVFQAAPLEEVGREIAERYRVRVEIADSVLARRTVTAWLSDRSLDQALAVVCTIVDAECRTTDSTVTMRAR